MTPWIPWQYEKVWDEFYVQCGTDTQETIDFRLDQLLEKGNLAREPVSKHLDGDIFELRAKDVRILFYFGASRTIVFVHALIKKRGDVPRRDIELAHTRKTEIEERRRTINAFSN